MKIEYEKIIELANKRKEVLVEVSELLERTEEHRDNMLDALGWIIQVCDALKQLDDEGRKLLPKPIDEFFLNRYPPSRMLAGMLDRDEYGRSGLNGVVEAL